MRTWPFWRDLAVGFCAFSLIGHWIEIAYCLVMKQLGVYDPDSLVWGDPFYPFFVYGIGIVVCSIALVPLKNALLKKITNPVVACLIFFIITVFVCMDMELIMGFMLNQPDADGVYPLWDNSTLPFNILKQAWLVNDIMLGLLTTLYTWLAYPLLVYMLQKIPGRVMNPFSIIFVIAFIFLCIYEFA